MINSKLKDMPYRNKEKIVASQKIKFEEKINFSKKKMFCKDENIPRSEIEKTNKNQYQKNSFLYTKIIANCQEGQTRIVILNNLEISDLYIQRENDENILGNIYIATITSILPNLEAMFLNAGLEKSVYISFNEIKDFDINSYKKGDKILIQIIKEPINTKGAKATTDISFPGKYLVYKPFDKGIWISKNIIDVKKRESLKNTLERLIKNKSLDGGIICRTEAEKLDAKCLIKIFKKEIKYLLKIWGNVKDKFEKLKNTIKNPELLHEDYNILIKIAREKLNQNITEFLIDSKKEYKKVLNFVHINSPELKSKITLYDEEESLFEKYKLESVFANIIKQKIYLKSGGYLIIQEAESLCAIDVNSGKTKGESLEAVTLKTNLEAVKEIALQLRLRNIGGIIVIDFIDMYSEEQKQKILEAMKESVKSDKAKIEILPITKMGLIEMTRERKTESILNFLSEECPYCHGTGKIYSKETLLINIKNELKKIIKEKMNIIEDKKTEK
ncbi:MAG: Rne/Rng family ribonuclease, partial [Elusimicrobiota bacterium]|nr:Rne/Rng family ribonuclease [Elusimicrobiota bacterium]